MTADLKKAFIEVGEQVVEPGTQVYTGGTTSSRAGYTGIRVPGADGWPVEGSGASPSTASSKPDTAWILKGGVWVEEPLKKIYHGGTTG